MTEVTQAGNDATDWLAANKYAALFGPLPSSITTFVRGCLKDSVENNNEFSKSSVFEVTRFLKSASMKAPLYYLTTSLYQDELDNLNYISAKEFLNLYKPFDLAAIFSLIYVCRRAERMIEEQDWNFLSEALLLRCEIGGLVGRSMPNIGVGLGLIAGTMRSLSLAAFLIHDAKGFGQYRRMLKTANKPFDLDYERERWGCTHPQVCSSLLVTLGVSSAFAQQIHNALLTGWDASDSEDTAEYKVKLVECWSDALLKNGQQPDIVHSGEFYPRELALGKLKRQAIEITQEGMISRWLLKRKEDVTPELTPKLFK